MISLYIDTSSSDVSIAIIKDDILLSSVINNIPNKHSVYTVPYIKEAIDKANIDKKEIDNIYVVNGPGSFTGIRIGLTVAKVYSYLIDNKIIPVSSLKALAISNNNDSNRILSVIKANKNNYYIGLYDNNYNEIIDEQFCSIDKIKEIISDYNPIIVGDSNIEIDDKKISKVTLDFVKIINYYKDKEKLNSFQVKANYLKLPQALEVKNDN